MISWFSWVSYLHKCSMPLLFRSYRGAKWPRYASMIAICCKDTYSTTQSSWFTVGWVVNVGNAIAQIDGKEMYKWFKFKLQILFPWVVVKRSVHIYIYIYIHEKQIPINGMDNHSPKQRTIGNSVRSGDESEGEIHGDMFFLVCREIWITRWWWFQICLEFLHQTWGRN